MAKPEVATINSLKELKKYGQSVWFDYIRRSLITSGELQRMIEEDGLTGVTSNPAIFEKAITGSTDYTEALRELEKRPELDAMVECAARSMSGIGGCSEGVGWCNPR